MNNLFKIRKVSKALKISSDSFLGMYTDLDKMDI
jgi:hypothetical protein